jgi:hypothetical protein
MVVLDEDICCMYLLDTDVITIGYFHLWHGV